MLCKMHSKTSGMNMTLIFLLLQRILWSCSAGDKAACDLKGKGPEDCQNYIRVLSAISEQRLLVCGTNCYNPLCRHYLMDGQGNYQVEAEFSGKGYAPYDPRHNSTAIYAGKKHQWVNL